MLLYVPDSVFTETLIFVFESQVNKCKMARIEDLIEGNLSPLVTFTFVFLSSIRNPNLTLLLLVFARYPKNRNNEYKMHARESNTGSIFRALRNL